MTALLMTVGIGFLLGAIGAIQEHWMNNEWVEKAEQRADEMGLPPATHRKAKWGRVNSIMYVDPDSGLWLWKAHRP
jgi:hypothetical protein